MKTSVIGYPRIGTLRELKFASEKYFRKEITSVELLDTAKSLRKIHWNTQKNSGIEFISSNDFSFYDMTLDTAVLFNIIPNRYKELNLSNLDTYFAMARGFQDNSGDVKALAMKKWFNTNYHYIVPEVEDDTEIKLVGNKLFDEYNEAKSLGIETKPVVIGPYTLLKLCRFTGNKTCADFVDAVITAYKDLVSKCEENGVKWLQVDEPSLVKDMTSDDLALFNKIYDEILSTKQNCKVLLQTYFGDVRDVYADLIYKPFDGIGLDFIEGKETYNLVNKFGFPSDKVLFAGLVNGKNIWKNHYEKTLETLNDLKNKGINTVLSTSCSLLHVPYTLKNETKLDAKYLSHFSFAEEKLVELSELKLLADLSDYANEETYKNNKKLFKEQRDCFNQAVHDRLSSVTDKDYTRLPARAERQKLQKLNLTYRYSQQQLSVHFHRLRK